MATFDQLESSQEGSNPFELYEFILGGVSFFYTSAEDEITVGLNVFTPIAISRGKLGQSGDQSTRTLTISMPTETAISQKYRKIPPGEKAVVNVFRFQRNESPAFATEILLFKGLVATCRFPNDGNTAEFAVRSVESSLNFNIPLYNFGGMCQLLLYSTACGADPTVFDHLGTCTSTSGDTITIDGLNASGLSMASGYIRPTGVNDFRMVLSQSGDVVTLLLPFQLDPTGQTMQAFAGCDHLIEGDCATTFDRVNDYRGYAFVPSRDIFASGL